MHFSAPGKLVVSGEWAILEVGNRGLVASVNNRVHVDIDKSDDIVITASEFGIEDAKAKYSNGQLTVDVDEEKKKTLNLLSRAIATSLKYLEEKEIKIKTFKIKTSSKDTQFDVNGEVKKIGFGSSAAVTVAAITAVLDFHGYAYQKDEIYKLATIAHFYAQGKIGSGFDVAASTYGGLFVYSRFDPKWLTEKVEAGEKLGLIVNEKWPGFVAEVLEVPKDFHLLVGWTKDSASTKEMVKQMNVFKEGHRDVYDKHFSGIAALAAEAITAFKTNNKEKFLELLQKNEQLLSDLGKASGVNIETPELKTLSEEAAKAGAAGKLSGAGGGDCGIAVCFDGAVAKKIKEAWKTAGLHLVDVTIDREGVKKDKSVFNLFH